MDTAEQHLQSSSLPSGSITLPLLQEGCLQLGIPLTDTQLAQFACFYEELVTWNEKFNLTGITDLAEVQTKHFLDSLVSLPLITELLGDTLPPARAWHCIDVGTGAGFPGVPLKIVAPRLKWTLMDGTGKKILFLRQLLEKLKLPDVNLLQGRAEELGRETRYRGQFDLVMARAVAPMNILAEYLLPLTRMGGLVVVYKGASAAQEFIAARKAIELLGGETLRMAPIKVPFLEEQRFIFLVKKVAPTPSLYPRGQGLARKKPLG
ncbi:MAG: 16S rRNA (guanine(527)-N(7))-methyltransferase RsmG [Caldilineaceae bacterium]|nr:16S rRNA (guanine(527)-N(7))-methyltransferase RsmG [Caldilineaceae bacterium]